MVSDRVRAPALAFILAALTSACGDDEAVPDGGGGALDASADAGDAAPLDAGDDLCPGQLTFEALVADAIDAEPAFDIAVAEVGGSAGTTSAPNGRAQLCLPSSADSRVRSTADTHLARLDSLSADAIDIINGAVQPYPLDVLEAAAADALLTDLTLTRDEEASLLLVSVVAYPDGEPLVGATVAIDKASDGSFARDAAGGFAAATEVGDGRVLLFANTALGGDGEAGQATVTVTPPGGFDGTCVGPPTVELEAGGLSGALFACQ
jgi:hypothetical protein